MANILVKDIIQDEEIYPRERLNQKTIDLYAERLREGIHLPPIEIQRVSLDGKVGLVIIDGIHRVEAYKKNNQKEIEYCYWKEDKVFDKANDEDWIELKLHSAEVNIIHGERLIEADTKRVARKVIERDPKFSETKLAKRLGVSQQTISNWVGDIKRRYEASQDNIIFRLHLLGWTQEEIGKVKGVQLSRSGVELRLTELPNLVKLSKENFTKKKSIAEIAQYYNIGQTLTWALVLNGLADESRFETLGLSPQLYNVWNFAGCDERMGQDHAGRIPGQIVLNALYYYSQPGDLVVDPMAGGGTTNDACLLLGRRCRSYDIQPKRIDIEKHNIAEGFPSRAEKCGLIFLDPPYWRLQRDQYAEESTSFASLEEWLNSMNKLARDCYTTVKQGGYIALVIEAFLDEKVTKRFLDLPFECLRFFTDVGFTEIQRIAVPMPSQIKDVHDVEYSKRSKIMLDLNRDLIVLRREK